MIGRGLFYKHEKAYEISSDEEDFYRFLRNFACKQRIFAFRLP